MVVFEAFYDFYLDKYEKTDLYSEWFYEYDASDQMAEHVASAIKRERHRVELQQFLENEATERWNSIFQIYAEAGRT